MIPNAISNTGPYANFWSHLKSIDHTLERIIALSQTESITELDKDRLEAYRIINNKAIPITNAFDFDKEYVYDAPYGDCFYSGNYTYYLNKKMCNTIGFRMLVGKEIEGMEKFYSAPNFKIYKILPFSS